MPRRKGLNAHDERELLNIPSDRESLTTCYTFTDEELAWTREALGDSSRLGFALQLALMKYPGVSFTSDWEPSPELIEFVAEQIGVSPAAFADYGTRAQTVQEHRTKLLGLLKLRAYNAKTDRPAALTSVEDLALQTDYAATIVRALMDNFREWRVLLPSITQLKDLASEAITRSERTVHNALTEPLTTEQRLRLRRMLDIGKYRKTDLAWIAETKEAPKAANIAEHLERIVYLRGIGLPDSLREKVHAERLEKLAKVGVRTHVHSLRNYKTQHQLATLTAIALESHTRIVDETLHLHTKMIGWMYNGSKAKYEEKKLADANALREAALLLPPIYNVLNTCRQKGESPYKALEKVVSWEEFKRLVEQVKSLTKDDDLGPIQFTLHAYKKIHKYTGEMLRLITFKAAPAAQKVLDAVLDVKRIHEEGDQIDLKTLRTDFITDKKWRSLVITVDGVDPRYYELCAMSLLSERLRSGDMWVSGSRQFKDFEDYLVPRAKFESLKAAGKLPLKIETDCEKYLEARIRTVAETLKRVEAGARANTLEGVIVTPKRIIISPLEAITPTEAIALSRRLYSLVPRARITEVLQEVESWTNFSRCFVDYRTGLTAPDVRILLTALLAKGLNFGCEKMAQACPNTSFNTLQNIDACHLRPEGFIPAFAMLINEQKKIPIAALWGDGSTSSSDGQPFRAGRHAYDVGSVNPHHGSDPMISNYTHTLDLGLPLFSNIIAGTAEEALHVLDGLLYHEADVEIKEHYTDTGGFSEHVFALTHLFGFRFAPRIRRFHRLNLHLPKGMGASVVALRSMIGDGDSLNLDVIRANWDDVLRLLTSIKLRTVSASVIMRKLSNYPRQNQLYAALRELGRIERTLHMLDWISNPDLRRRTHRGLNKGEAIHAIVRAVALNRNGEIRDRTQQQQIRRTRGFNLLVSVIGLWNTVYLNRAFKHLRSQGEIPDPELMKHIAPLGHEHILLTGDYIWKETIETLADGYRPLNITGGKMLAVPSA